MAWIGGYEFMSAHGPEPELAGDDLGDITRPGVPGKAFWYVGKTAQPISLLTRTACSNVYAIGLAVTAYAGLKGTLVSYTDDKGNTWLNLVVRQVRTIRSFRTLNPTLAGVDYVLETEWVLEHVSA